MGPLSHIKEMTCNQPLHTPFSWPGVSSQLSPYIELLFLLHNPGASVPPLGNLLTPPLVVLLVLSCRLLAYFRPQLHYSTFLLLSPDGLLRLSGKTSVGRRKVAKITWATLGRAPQRRWSWEMNRTCRKDPVSARG